MPNVPLGYLTAAWRGRYFESANAGRAFAGGNQVVVPTAFTAGVPTAYTGGLVLANPTTSTANISVNVCSIALIATQTNAASIGLGVAHSASALSGTLTVVPNVCTNVGSANTSQGRLYSSASVTLPVAPKLALNLTSVPVGGQVANGYFDIGGQIVLAPGSYCVFLSTATGTASSFLGSFGWEEIPVGTSL